MNKLCLNLYFLLLSFLLSNPNWASENVEGYDPYNRPLQIQEIIEERFQDISSTEPYYRWAENGSEKYRIGGLDEHKLLKSIILGSPRQRIFYVLDLGGGDFQWGHSISKFLNEDHELAKHPFKVTMINTRGEQIYRSETNDSNKCTIYNFGAFKVENLKESLHKKGLFKNDETFDLIVSSWCLRHLTDPLGTLIQAYNLLGSKRVMLFDGFRFSLAFQDEKHDHDLTCPKLNCLMVKSLLDLKIPFLMHRYDQRRSMNQFIIQKSEENILHLPYTYDGFQDTGVSQTGMAQYYLKFRARNQENNMKDMLEKMSSFQIESCIQYDNILLYGDEGLFDFLEHTHAKDCKPLKLLR